MDTREIVMPSGGSDGGLLGGGGIGALLIGALLFGGGMGGLGMGNRGGNYGNYGGGGLVANAATGAVADSIVLNPAFQSLQHQISGIENTLNSHNTDVGITSINQNISGTSRDQLNSIANLSTAQAAANFTTLSSINGLGRDITAAQTQALINSLQNFNTLQGNLTTTTNLIIAGQNAQNAEQARCCCDIKQLILSDGNLTRALINSNTMQDLRDKNVVLAGEVSNFRQNQFLIDKLKPGTPVIF